MKNIADDKLNDERIFLEELLNYRINFLLVLYGVVLAGVFTSDSTPRVTFVLIAGLTICTSLSLGVYRAYVKHHWIMDELKRRPGTVVSVVESGVKPLGWRALFSVQKVNGLGLPIFCCLSLLIGILANVMGWMR